MNLFTKYSSLIGNLKLTSYCKIFSMIIASNKSIKWQIINEKKKKIPAIKVRFDLRLFTQNNSNVEKNIPRKPISCTREE